MLALFTQPSPRKRCVAKFQTAKEEIEAGNGTHKTQLNPVHNKMARSVACSLVINIFILQNSQVSKRHYDIRVEMLLLKGECCI